LAKVPIQELRVPVVTNVEADINASKERVKDLLVRQVFHPVRWEESMRKMVDEGVERVVEIGPGKVLTGLMKRIAGEVETANLQDLETLKKLSTFLRP
jgi:[acyl-carrier-protein] S-malonyltransferase